MKSQRLWASFYTGFSDKTELQIHCNWEKVARHTGLPVEQLKFIQNSFNECQQISCFTYTISDFMWREYANNGNGFCLQFTLDNTDMFFPIVYLNKSKIDFTDDLILAMKKTDLTSVRKLALLPPFLKRIKYKDENELRFFCGNDYDNENGIMGGRAFAGKAQKMGVNGIYYDYSHAGISLKKIFFGDNCSLNHRELLNRILV